MKIFTNPNFGSGLADVIADFGFDTAEFRSVTGAGWG
jgi:hypothetical protein